MTTNVTYRDAGAVVPISTTVKGAPLSNSEIDGNFKSMVDSVDAKVDSSDLAAPGGAALVGADDGSSGSLWTTVAGFIAFLLSSLGSSVIGFIQSGIGAIRRSMQDKSRELVSVKDFGAVGDGVADDTDAIRKAIAAVAAAGGGEVRLPNGRYRITDTIRVPSFVVLRGISVGGFPYYGPTGKSSVIVVDFGASVYKWAIEPDTRYITGDGTIPYNTLLQGEDLGSVWRGVYGAGVVGLHITTKKSDSNRHRLWRIEVPRGAA